MGHIHLMLLMTIIIRIVSAEGGTENNMGDKVRVVFFDSSGGTNPRTNMSVTFKAKEDITTSNPTEFNITAEGLANSDASVTYDDITTPITKNVTVEPEYVDYTLSLESVNGTLVKGEENEMKLTYSSPMGKYYEKARLVAEKTSGTGDVKLLATDEQSLEHDIIESGWGEEQGYEIGGKDVIKEINMRGIFDKAGEYTITFKLIDRDNSDSIIAEKAFTLNVQSETAVIPPVTGETEETPEEVPENTEENNQGTTNEENLETPTSLPKTGNTAYITILPIMMVLVEMYFVLRKKD